MMERSKDGILSAIVVRMFLVVMLFVLSCASVVVYAQKAELKPRLVVCTDIGAPDVEPDDMESAIRLMAYADLFEIGKYYEYYGYEIARMPEDRIEIPNDAQDVLLSEDGLGYVFVTIKTAEK